MCGVIYQVIGILGNSVILRPTSQVRCVMLDLLHLKTAWNATSKKPHGHTKLWRQTIESTTREYESRQQLQLPQEASGQGANGSTLRWGRSLGLP